LSIANNIRCTPELGSAEGKGENTADRICWAISENMAHDNGKTGFTI
jgi:hypothetical protein